MSGPSPIEDSAERDTILHELSLSLVDGVGPRIYQQLREAFGDAKGALNAPIVDLRSVPGVGNVLVERIRAARDLAAAEEEIAFCRSANVRILSVASSDYPAALREIPDPPAILFVRGEILPRDEAAVAIVGTRHCTTYGRTQAERFAAGLASAGITVVSGLARGVDKAAHEGALGASGRTLAVLGSGVCEIYPPEHGELAERVIAAGALISEGPPRRGAIRGAFPQRNRIVTGLSRALLVIEADVQSGAMISARHAMEQNREVFALPGRIDDRTSHGCHRLIRDGARLLESVDDVLEELGPMPSPVRLDEQTVLRKPAELLLNEQESLVLQAIPGSPVDIDSLVVATGLPVHRILATLSVLETRRLVRRISGQTVMRAN
jgi:DNA processing protein